MRELHIETTPAHRDAVESALDERGVDYVATPESADGDRSNDARTRFTFPLPTAAVNDVLADLRDAGVDDNSYTVVTKAEIARTPRFDDLQERYSASVRKLSKIELHAKISEMQWPYQIYYIGTVLSVLAAASGLLLDQPALIIGAMIIAPQASSALAAPAGVLLSDWGMFVTSIKEQALGLALAILGAAAFGWFVRWTGFVPPLLTITGIELVGVRMAPTFLSTVGAVIAGVVGAFGYTTEQSTALIGVMIAAALIPSAATVGLAVAWAAPLLAIGASLLLLVNLVAINGGAFLTLLGMGYEPDWRAEGSSFRESISSDRRAAVYGTLLVLLVTLLGTGYLVGTNVVFTQSVNQEVQDTLDQSEYSDLSLSRVGAEYGGRLSQTGATDVSVRVSRSSERDYPDLAGELERRIERRTGRDVTVTVSFVDTRTANTSDQSATTHSRAGRPSTEEVGELGNN